MGSQYVPKKSFNMSTTRLFISYTVISNGKLKLAKKNKQKLSNILTLNFYYLKIIRFLHRRYLPKIIGDILENVQKTSAFVLVTL